jgi:hypothetical protein
MARRGFNMRKTINHKTGAVTYNLYSKEEADEKGIEYVDWRDVKESGQWILSDDGYVAIAYTVKEYPDKRNKDMNRFIKTAFGTAFHTIGNNKKRFNLFGNEVDYSITGKRTLRGKRKQRLRMIARNYALSNNLEESIDRVTYDFKEMKKYNWRSWTKTEEFHNMVREEITKLLAEKGFSEAQTIDLLEETIGIAKAKNDTRSLVTIVQTLLRMHGIDQPTKTKTTDELEARTIDYLIDDATQKEREIEYKGRKKEERESYSNG